MGYLTLVGEMAKRNITNESIANLLGIHRNSVYNKLRGITSFSVEEAVVIRDEFFPGSDIDELFEKEEKKAGSMRDSPSESTK